MALTAYEKAMIKESITSDIIAPEENLTVSELNEVAKAIRGIVNNPEAPNNEYITFQPIFNNPEKIINTTDKAKDKNRSTELERPTNGEVRKHMISCVDKIIADEVETQKIDKATIAWNKEELLKLVDKKPDNDKTIPLARPALMQLISRSGSNGLSLLPDNIQELVGLPFIVLGFNELTPLPDSIQGLVGLPPDQQETTQLRNERFEAAFQRLRGLTQEEINNILNDSSRVDEAGIGENSQEQGVPGHFSTAITSPGNERRVGRSLRHNSTRSDNSTANQQRRSPSPRR